MSHNDNAYRKSRSGLDEQQSGNNIILKNDMAEDIISTFDVSSDWECEVEV
ncbi:hypothetical protein D3C73_1535900 [compost metagenome]